MEIGDLVTVKTWCKRNGETGVIVSLNEKTEDYQILLPSGVFWLQKRDIKIVK